MANRTADAVQRSGESLTDDVYEKLLRRFLNNELVPGNILDRKQIAEELGVSMAPVREALMRLSMEGFVETIPRKGTITKAVSRDDVYGSLMVREAIECQAARLYCGKPIADKRASLEEYARKVDAPSDDLVEHWKLDIGFHQQLIDVSNCRALSDEYRRYMRVATFYHVNTFLQNDDRSERLSHIDLLDQLTTSDPDRAEKVIRDHLKSGKRRFF